MKPRKKNSFFAFIFSFFPGAAEMYMGCMKNGLSLMIVFFAPMLVTSFLYISDYFVVILSCIAYIFSFFHARNLATMPEDEIVNMEDTYIWDEFMNGKKMVVPSAVVKKWIAIVLIFFGVNGMWMMFKNNLYILMERLSGYQFDVMDGFISGVPKLVFSLFIIVVGICLIVGKKKKMMEVEDDGGHDEGSSEE